jgi:hypothetical protein
MSNMWTAWRHGELQKHFAERREFHRLYTLAQVEVYTRIGPLEMAWIWTVLSRWPWRSSAPQRNWDWTLTRHVQLTLLRSYVPREPITGNLETSSQPATPPVPTASNSSKD